MRTGVERTVYVTDEKRTMCQKKLFKNEKKALAFMKRAERKGLIVACCY